MADVPSFFPVFFIPQAQPSLYESAQLSVSNLIVGPIIAEFLPPKESSRKLPIGGRRNSVSAHFQEWNSFATLTHWKVPILHFNWWVLFCERGAAARLAANAATLVAAKIPQYLHLHLFADSSCLIPNSNYDLHKTESHLVNVKQKKD